MLALTDAQLRCWRDLLEARTGVQITPRREGFIRSLIGRRMDELGEHDVDAYFNYLAAGEREREWRVLLDGILIKETHFFRHRPSFDYVERLVRKKLAEGENSMTAWSAGCATGEEAYSLAMAMKTACPPGDTRPLFAVVGSDICSSALKEARAGIYRNRQLKQVTQHEHQRYFECRNDEHFEVAADIKKRVCFVENNILLAKQATFASNVDIIFCQNVLIYFKRWQRRDVVAALAGKLKPGGCLVLGLGEYSDRLPEGLSRDACRDVQAYIRTG